MVVVVSSVVAVVSSRGVVDASVTVVVSVVGVVDASVVLGDGSDRSVVRAVVDASVDVVVVSVLFAQGAGVVCAFEQLRDG